MKSLNKILFLGLAFVLAWGACKKEETQVVLNPSAKLVATLSANTVVLLKDQAANDALTVSWTTPDFGFPAAASYSIYIDKKGNNFAKPSVIGVGADLKKVFKSSELNTIMLNLGLLPGAVSDLDFRVDCLIGAATVLSTTINNLKATAYSEKLDLTTTWGVVGDATPGGWNGPDLPMYKTDVANELVAYVSLNAGQIKFRQNNDWAVNLGATGSVEPNTNPSGSLVAGGKNLGVTKGTYKITMNPVALTYKIEAYSWGVVGDATANGWNGPDAPLMYDPTVDLWRGIITVNNGQIKFRQNNDWAVNYGSTGSVEPDPILTTGVEGGLAAGGKNFGITKGTYLVTLDLKKLKYTCRPYKPIGIVGDATPGGWGGPDVKFTYDLSTKKWNLDNVVLTAGQIKFRENDDWANNWGATGSVEPAPIGTTGALSAGGKNFGVTAGTWSFELDFTDTANPKYTATKK
jgi:starch-binding outer membrane protein SusE/F